MITDGARVADPAGDPNGVLLSQEIAADFEVGVGDTFPVTIYPDDLDLSQKLSLHLVGIPRDSAGGPSDRDGDVDCVDATSGSGTRVLSCAIGARSPRRTSARWLLRLPPPLLSVPFWGCSSAAHPPETERGSAATSQEAEDGNAATRAHGALKSTTN